MKIGLGIIEIIVVIAFAFIIYLVVRFIKNRLRNRYS